MTSSKIKFELIIDIYDWNSHSSSLMIILVPILSYLQGFMGLDKDFLLWSHRITMLYMPYLLYTFHKNIFQFTTFHGTSGMFACILIYYHHPSFNMRNTVSSFLHYRRSRDFIWSLLNLCQLAIRDRCYEGRIASL
jgi:hypothetical protein